MAGTAGASWLIADFLHLPLDVWAGANGFGKGRFPAGCGLPKIFPPVRYWSGLAALIGIAACTIVPPKW